MKLERKIKTSGIFVILALLLSITLADYAGAGDWPQWRGMERDGKSNEVGLAKKWPEGGPALLWSAEGLGKGYASLCVANGAIYTTGMKDGQGFLTAYDLKGKGKWEKSYGPEWDGSYTGSRSTPTMDDGLLYIVSGMGQVHCFEAASGQKKWTVDMIKEFAGINLKWGIAESPLVVDDKVICTPGGEKIAVVALDKKTGKTIWTTTGLGDKSGYCSPILIKIGKKRLIVTMLQETIVALDLSDGKVVWSIPHQTKYGISAVSPLYHQGNLYVSNGYGKGMIMYEISPDGTSYTKKWEDKNLDCRLGGVVLDNGFIYGSSTKGVLYSLGKSDGKVAASNDKVGSGSTIYADGMLYCYEEKKGTVSLVKPADKSLDIVSSFVVQKGADEYWAHPAISDGRLYIRHGDALLAYDITEPVAINQGGDKK